MLSLYNLFVCVCVCVFATPWSLQDLSPDQGSNLEPWQWKHSLTTGMAGTLTIKKKKTIRLVSLCIYKVPIQPEDEPTRWPQIPVSWNWTSDTQLPQLGSPPVSNALSTVLRHRCFFHIQWGLRYQQRCRCREPGPNLQTRGKLGETPSPLLSSNRALAVRRGGPIQPWSWRSASSARASWGVGTP